MPMQAMNKIAHPDFTKINGQDFHQSGRRLLSHQTGTINTQDKLVQFNVQDQATELGKVASYGKGTNTSLLQFGNN